MVKPTWAKLIDFETTLPTAIEELMQQQRERQNTHHRISEEITMIQRMDHIGIVVDDLAAATAFFVELGLELEGEATLENNSTVDRVNGLEGVRADVVMFRTPDGHGAVELCRYHTPSSHHGDPGAPTNTLGFRHIAFAVEGIDDILDRLRPHGAELVGEVAQYEDSYRLCYVRGPAGVIIELAEKLG